MTTHDVIPIRETQHYWGMHPHDNVTIGKGGKVVFRTAIGFFDIAAVTEEEWAACDVSNAEMWVNAMGDVQVEGAGESEKKAPFYEFSYSADTPGTYYILGTGFEGGYCRAGTKTVLTVTDSDSDEEVKVMGSAVPFWTVGVGYAGMTIELGDSLRFVSDTEGYHDVALVDTSVCSAPDYECCTMTGVNDVEEVLYSTDDYKNKGAEYTWTPDSTGYYEVVCSVDAHCLFGQKFNVTVVDAPTSSAAQLQGSAFALVAVILAMIF